MLPAHQSDQCRLPSNFRSFSIAFRPLDSVAREVTLDLKMHGSWFLKYIYMKKSKSPLRRPICWWGNGGNTMRARFRNRKGLRVHYNYRPAGVDQPRNLRTLNMVTVVVGIKGKGVWPTSSGERIRTVLVSSASDLHPQSGRSHIEDDAKNFDRCVPCWRFEVWNFINGMHGMRLFVGDIVRTGIDTMQSLLWVCKSGRLALVPRPHQANLWQSLRLRIDIENVANVGGGGNTTIIINPGPTPGSIGSKSLNKLQNMRVIHHGRWSTMGVRGAVFESLGHLF